MPTLLSIPAELRNIIYQKLLIDARVAYTPQFKRRDGSTAPLTTIAALLITCKQIHIELEPLFYATARMDITMCIDPKNGVVDLPVKPSMFQHVKIGYPEAHTATSTVKLIRSLTNLQSLTVSSFGSYYGPSPDDLEKGEIECTGDCHIDCDCIDTCEEACEDHCHCEGDFDYVGYLDHIMACVEDQVKERPNAIVGKCLCNEDPEYAADCACDEGIRKAVTIWEYLEQPFELICEVDLGCHHDVVDYMGPNMVGLFNLGSKKMRLVMENDHTHVMHSFDVPLDGY